MRKPRHGGASLVLARVDLMGWSGRGNKDGDKRFSRNLVCQPAMELVFAGQGSPEVGQPMQAKASPSQMTRRIGVLWAGGS